MTPSLTQSLLWTFAALEFVIGVVMLAVFGNVAIGASSMTIGASLVAVAASQRKKIRNG